MGVELESFHQIMTDSNFHFFAIHDIQHSANFLMREVGEDKYDLIDHLLANLPQRHVDDRRMGSQEGSMASNFSLLGAAYQQAIRAGGLNNHVRKRRIQKSYLLLDRVVVVFTNLFSLQTFSSISTMFFLTE